MFLMPFRVGESFNAGNNCHAHADIELLAVQNGRGRQLVGSEVLPCRSGEIYIFPVGCLHMSATGPGEGFAMTVLNLLPRDLPPEAGALLGRLVERVGRGGRLSVRPSTGQRAAALLRRAAAERIAAELGSACSTQALVVEAVVALARDAERTEVAAQLASDRHIAQAQRWLEDYWMTPVRVADLVALGQLGRSQFLARFRAASGRTVGDALLAIRLREAQRLMRDGKSNLLDVALACGFGSQSHFNHRFKQATGLSPRAWLARG